MINLIFPVQGIAYAKINISPKPISVTPLPPEGVMAPSVRNHTQEIIYQFVFQPNTKVVLSKNQYTGSNPNSDITLTTANEVGTTISGSSITIVTMENFSYDVFVQTTDRAQRMGYPDPNWIADPYICPSPVSEKGVFRIYGPKEAAMITDTRRPALNWSASPGAKMYSVFLNVSRTDYDWAAPGTLLDRYTLIADVFGTSYILQQDLPDRWTYKWYVVATDEAGTTNRSDVGIFSIYQPVLTSVKDGISIVNGCRDLNKNGTIEPYEDWRNPPEVRVADLVSRMTTHQKAMQLLFNTQEFPEAGFGFGPFSVHDFLNFQIAAARTSLGIPNIVIGDTIHGYKTSYPTQPGLAATRDLQTAWSVADMQRRESLAVGNRGTLSPLAEIGTKVLYPRIQEGCGENADFAAGMVRAMVAGLQGGPEVNPLSMMITVKHWPGLGAGGETGAVYDGTSIWYHMRPWHAAIEAGASGIMPGYGGSWLLNTQEFGAGDDAGILSFLRNTMCYKGLICTDWLPPGVWTRACVNGSDVMGGANPAEMASFENEVPLWRLDEAVKRVLDLKFRLGLFEDPYGDNINGITALHTPENVEIARCAASKSLTLLKNSGSLPIRLPEGSSIVVDGRRADDPDCMTTWHSDFNEKEFGSKTIYRAIADRAAQDRIAVFAPMARIPKSVPLGTKIDTAIVVVGESYYTHGTFWEKESPYLPDDPIGPAHDTHDAPQYALIEQYRNQNIPTIVICLLPRPYVLTNVTALADALMVVYRPGDEGGVAIAEMLWGDHLPMGKTPWQLPLSVAQVGVDDPGHFKNQPDRWDLPYDLGAEVDEIIKIREAIASGEQPGPIFGKPLFQYGSGIQGFGLIDPTPPLAFTLLTPFNGQICPGAPAFFTWEPNSDPETGIQRYELFLNSKLVAISRKATTAKLTEIGLGNGRYSWYVKAYNWANGITTSPIYSFSINDTTPPAAFRTLRPTNDATVVGTDLIAFYWEQSADEGTGLMDYKLLVDGETAATVLPSPFVSSTTDLALGKRAYASSTSHGRPSEAVDGDAFNTRWASSWLDVSNPDSEWLTVDLGAVFSIKRVVIKWEAPAKNYLIQVSSDNTTWTTIFANDGCGGNETDHLSNLTGIGRYVRMQGVQRGTGYGYSIWEFQVFGLGAEWAKIMVPLGIHTWLVQVMDLAGNLRINEHGTQTIRCSAPKLHA